jgi:hypothetical protein
VLETYLERVPTLLGDADDQHLVIMAQRLRVSGITRRCTAKERAEELLCESRRRPDASRDARAASNENVASDAAVDVALDGRADLGDQIVCLAIH